MKLRTIATALRDTARSMIGVPSYDNYLAHMAAHHPDRPAMAYADFFRDRQDARFGGKGKGGFRCC
ncbi:MAG TPA: YbdD/YjiX family protein [Sphingomonas sp.]|nr:YbdD/YjiX family protein [Sphingomonas sp.]